MVRLASSTSRGSGAASMANLTVAPDGSFYPCEGFVGQEEYRLGDVTTGFDEAAMAHFSRLYVDDKPGCQDCWARYQCGGGCYLLGAMVNNDIAKPDPAECELTRFLVELAVWTLFRVQTQRPAALGELQQWCDEQGWFGKETLISRMIASKSNRIELPMFSASSSGCRSDGLADSDNLQKGHDGSSECRHCVSQ